MEVRAARHGERDEVLDLLGQWYNDHGEFFARYNHNDPGFRDALCLVARDGGQLVSTVQIFDRAINLDGQSVPMGGIGSVFTLEEYRHNGVASALMRLAVDTMVREGFEVSLLFAERLTFYNQFGWREIERKFSILAGAASLNAPDLFVINSLDMARESQIRWQSAAPFRRRLRGIFRGVSRWRTNRGVRAGDALLRPFDGDGIRLRCRRGRG